MKKGALFSLKMPPNFYLKYGLKLHKMQNVFFFFCSWQTLKSDSHLPKKFVLLAWLKAL